MTDYKLAVTSVIDSGNRTEPKTVICRDILGYHGYDFHMGVDPNWTGWPCKLRYIINYVMELDDSYTHVMFLDARDVVLLAGPDEIMERYFALDHPWVYNAEVNIWSPNSFLPEDYPPCDTLWRYLNSGASIAELGHIRKWHNVWTDNGANPPIHLPKGDQDWMAERYLAHYPEAIKLDTGCTLFQTMCGSDRSVDVEPGKMYNRITETYPLIIHFNGGTDITDPDRRELWQHYFKNPATG